MSLLITGIQRVKAFVPMFLAVALAASMSLLGVPSASANAGVTVNRVDSYVPCALMSLEVTNHFPHVVYVRIYEVRNGVRVDRNLIDKLAPGESFTASTDGERYFAHSLGVTSGTYGVGPTGPGWTDWGAIEFVAPSDCPPMTGVTKLSRRTKSVTKKSRPVVRFKTTAYSTDLGYQVVGKGKRIKWSEYWQSGSHTMFGPRLKPGQRIKVKFFSRSRDDSGVRTDPVYIGKKKFKRTRR